MKMNKSILTFVHFGPFGGRRLGGVQQLQERNTMARGGYEFL